MNNLAKLKKDIAERLEGSRALEFRAILGRADGTVKSRGENVYITLYNGDVLEVYNGRLPRVPYRKVWIGYDDENPTLLQVLRFQDVYDTRPHPNLPNHKESHTWFGYDPLELYTEQIMELLPRAAGGLIVRVHGGRYLCNGSYHITPNIDVDLTAEAVANGAEWVNAEIDEDGVVTHQHSANVATRNLLLPENIPATSALKKLLFSAKMYEGLVDFIQTRTDSDIFDPRMTGVGSGGLASAIDWTDILNVPSEFNPDLTVTDAIYPRKWLKSVDPTMDDDYYSGYSKLDLWLNQATSQVFICLDDDPQGAAVWLPVGGAAGLLIFNVEGALSVLDSAAQPILITQNTTISAVYVYCEKRGTSGQTSIDVVLNECIDTTIFNDVSPDYPTLPYNDANGWVKVIPTTTDFIEGDILQLNILECAVGAANLTVILQVAGVSGGGGSFNLVVEELDGTPSVSNVGKIIVPNGMLQNNGGGSVTLKNVELVFVRDEKTSGTNGGTFTSGAWRTRDLNTIVSDAGSHASLATNQITLEAGVYEYEIEATAFRCNSHQARLYNITDAAVVSVGSVAYADSGADGSSNSSKVFGRMVITASKAFEVQHRCATTAANTGFGQPASFGTEVYTVARFWKVG